jgi:hypothetical protein
MGHIQKGRSSCHELRTCRSIQHHDTHGPFTALATETGSDLDIPPTLICTAFEMDLPSASLVMEKSFVSLIMGFSPGIHAYRGNALFIASDLHLI